MPLFVGISRAKTATTKTLQSKDVVDLPWRVKAGEQRTTGSSPHAQTAECTQDHSMMIGGTLLFMPPEVLIYTLLRGEQL